MKKDKVVPVKVDTEPLKRFLNKQQNLKLVRQINDLDEFQSLLEKTREQEKLNLVVNGLHANESNISNSVIQKMRDQCILVIIDEIDSLFLTLKEKL